MERLVNQASESIERDDDIGGTGLSVGAMQGVARRQLVGSLVVAMFIAAVAGLAAIKPARNDAISPPTRGFAVIQQPVFTTPAGDHMAAARNAIEVP
jgi:hypothetical protein